ncbi:MAG TPA: hydrogenase expression/formation protein HypE [Solibacterales bacterium]|nr:hydrogenase expression/formation protein HypE [Bryobacterales bacterium]
MSDWSCPLPLRDYPRIVLAHGGGGALSTELVEHLFLPAFRNPALEILGDSAVVPLPAGRIALSTDSFVVRPLVFPGGSIGDLAINGTVNDLAMNGARPLYLTAGFILEEGLALDALGGIVQRMAAAARAAGVAIVTGDTKVVERGHGDGVYINTAGVGLVPEGLLLGPRQVRPGDAVLLSGTIGDHGMAIMSVREGLSFESPIVSDCAPLHGLVARMLEVPGAVRMMRDPTRGGLAASLQEIALAAGVGILLDERQLPVRPEVQGACELLGLDPLHVANEGKLTAVVAPADAAAVLARMHAHPLGAEARIIGTVTEGPAGTLACTTAIGATRIVPRQLGEQLPRIC